MSLPRFFLESVLTSDGVPVVSDRGATGVLRVLDLPDAPIPLPLSVSELHHAAVLRLVSGEHIAVVDSNDDTWEIELSEVSRDTITGRIVAHMPRSAELRVTLVQGVSKGERMDLTVRQATELGISRIIPLLSERCIVRLGADKRAAKGERWRRIALSSAKQSGRATVPFLTDPLELSEVFPLIEGADLIITAWEEAVDGSIRQVMTGFSPDADVVLFIGPEGGFSADEVARLQAAGSKVVSLGDTILRTETAGVVASALVLYELGGLGNR